ncbi:steroid 17-alpha-hydroxylase/17,20 lyase-like [Rhipicephalus sanguineus]|uniref:steroid 17-alpha-hydroxylase/17,20 lyase-like n=1 Tax=Rhipicephalus sanguineus TaxID=34632 RepID=UPI0020C45837|nr:steroid 17-alpha-hydroxylase/17,20 lyase-like [Rhipicephalus sanguineus]
MTVLGCFFSLLDWRGITTALVFVVTYLLSRFYSHVSKYPKGPFPLPLVGNLLALRNVTDLHAKSTEWSKTYGDAFTLWMAHRPMVMLNSYAVIREALVERRHDFAGRFPTRTAVLQNQGNHDIVFEDYNAHWKALRKVALSAVRLHEEKNDIERLENINHRFYEISPNGLPSDIAPILAILYLKREKKMAAVFRELGEILHRLFSKAEATYIPGNIENFTHAMLAAREEAIKEDKADAPYLTKASMILATVNLFNAGSNTSTGTLQWLLLRTAKEQRLQERIKKEIEDNIGSVPPVYGDREKLPFTVACLLETLRMHPATPLGIPHNTTTDTRIGKWNIPKDTGMMYNIHAVHHDPKNWENPEEFRPERFLDPVTGKVCTDVGPLITFGQGARSCPGEKLAQMDMFYIFVRLMQRVTVSVPSGSSDVNWNGKGSSLFLHPARQNIVYTRIS